MKARSIIAAVCLAGFGVTAAVAANPSRIHPEALGKTRWLTTEVYLEGHPGVNVKDDYPGVIGLSMWNMQTNRYEFFDVVTGASKLNDGGGGYFFITGDRKYHVNVPDKGTGAVVRTLEVLDDKEFTYSRTVPEKLVDGNQPVKIYVVHKPYHGPVKTRFTVPQS